MSPIPFHARYKVANAVTVLSGGVLPIAGGVVADWFFPEVAWVRVPLHSALEAFGAFAGLSLAGVLVSMQRSRAAGSHSLWTSSALVGMGVLDGLHACVAPGVVFVWLHSTATLAGGGLHAMVWLSGRFRVTRALPLIVLVAAGLFGGFSIAAPGALPMMERESQFTLVAKTVNNLGGLFFLAAAAWFLLRYRTSGQIEDLLFTNYMLLCGMAGLLFQSSRVWEGDWWWWHVVRLIASMILLGHAFQIHHNTEQELKSMNATLERRVAERSEVAEQQARALTRTNEQLNQEIHDHASAEQALRSSERRYHQFIEGARDAIVITDEQGLITYFNAAAREVFGYSACEVAGRPVTLLMPPEFVEAHENGMRRYMQTREAHAVGRTVEVRGRRKNGETFPLDLSLSALELPEGVVFLGAIRDVTQRHNMQARILQSEKLASLGLLSAGMAHEINNPLAYVASNLAVLQRDVCGLLAVLGAYEDAREFLEDARPEIAEKVARLAEEADLPYVKENIEPILTATRNGVKRVADIVKSLRGFARLDQAKFDRVNLHDSIVASLEMIRGRLKRHNINVNERFGDVPLVACAPAQINQVILNLLVNAMHAIEETHKNSGLITIRTRTDGEEAVVEIEDDGPGIPAEILPRIFDPFFTTKEVGKGTGLGLSISHGIVSDHGGRIEVESVPGLETKVRMILPIKGKESA